MFDPEFCITEEKEAQKLYFQTSFMNNPSLGLKKHELNIFESHQDKKIDFDS